MRLLSHLLLLVLLLGALPARAQDAPVDPACPGAPAPRLTVDGFGRVLPGDANNLRDQPSRNGERIGAIPGGAGFTVLEGPVCADGLNWWRVQSESLTGWTVEGANGAYWVEPAAPTAPEEGWINPFRSPQELVANRMTVGAETRVQTMDGEPLPLFAALDQAAPIDRLPVNARVTLLEEGPNGWWRVASDDGLTGWVREAVAQAGTAAGLRPTLAPICPHTENRVVFLAYDSALGSNLYTVGRDGAHLCNLSYGLQQDFEVYDWSPDGQWIAFSAVLTGRAQCAAGCSGEVYVVSIDGSELRRLTFGQNASHVLWSPDGAWLAVQVDGEVSGTRDLRLIAPDGSAERTLLTAEDGLWLMRWSPDSRQIAVIVSEHSESRFTHAVNVVDITSGEARTVLESSWRQDSLAWSPDGLHLAVATYANARSQLVEVDVVSGAVEVLVDADTRGGAYSPDGAQLAFWRTDLGAARWLEVIDLATREVMRVATLLGVNGRGVSWVPEGDALLISASGVMRVSVPDGALRSLFVGAHGSNWYPPLVQPSAE